MKPTLAKSCPYTETDSIAFTSDPSLAGSSALGQPLPTSGSGLPQVDIIPATRRHLQNGDQFLNQDGLRVAAYCRVSTEEESQEGSYAAQKKYYTSLICEKSSWRLAGIYADEGKSGTTRRKRIQFNLMLQDAKAGKMDYIITKSISRFARNTADALDCIHELQRLHPPVGIYFERENIDSLNSNCEMFLTFYCSMAQEESRSISENIKWSIQKNFRSGKPQINLRRMLGYDQCRDGNWAINEEQAGTVRYIYDRFLEGISANAIARELTRRSCPTVNGGLWRADTIFKILRNEKYAGDLIMQKTYTESFLTHKSVRNNGEYEKYILTDHHPAIIDRNTWNRVQAFLMQKQRAKCGGTDPILSDGTAPNINSRGRGPVPSPFAGIICARCGSPMRRMSYHTGSPMQDNSNGKVPASYAVWKCPNSTEKCGSDQSGRTCPAAPAAEISMKHAFMEMLYDIKKDILLHREDSEIVRLFRQVQTQEAISAAPVLASALGSVPEPSSSSAQGNASVQSMAPSPGNASVQSMAPSPGNASALSMAPSPGNASALGMAPAPDSRSQPQILQVKQHLLDLQILDLRKEYELALHQGISPVSENLLAQLELKTTLRKKLADGCGCTQDPKKSFQDFLNAVTALPEPDEAALPGSDFSHYIIRSFMNKKILDGDQLHYETTFGVRLTSFGNLRSAQSFFACFR
ncbi:recombinase family protein [Hespellia stercorisuis]|uniref:Site-specific DNA recombinase n=1 Tax=Hespellia stercorisuis DSM 15480 TaxID=1121950 RepID=A0A1M6S7P2_9FIRM|nr:recombinase family protein [Hespellia stercorisuis]SHK40735.1 Site-specific DNA recombinase [Hespellia stercorisuis DSM 15480]